MSDAPSTLPGADGPARPRRRDFLAWLAAGCGVVGASLAGVPILGFMLAPLFRRTPDVWRAVGAVGSFRAGSTVEVAFLDASPLVWAGVTAKTGAWLRRNPDGSFVAFALNCTHLGCPVRWLDGAGLFMCPCHGGVYYADGKVAAGPPPKPLTRYPVRVRDGQVEIRADAVPIT